MNLENIPTIKGATHPTKRLGRGEGSGHGKTSGKGHKGQLLNQIGLNPEEIINPVIDESKIHCSVITKTVIEVAFQKANFVKKNIILRISLL